MIKPAYRCFANTAHTFQGNF